MANTYKRGADMAILNTSPLTIKSLVARFQRSLDDSDIEAALLALNLLERETVVQRLALQLAGSADA